MSELLESIQSFLYEEANLLDERRFEEWLELFEPDAYYYMPCRPDADRNAHHSALIDDDVRGLRMRITRLRLPSAHTEHPRPSAVRLISNICAVSTTPIVVRAKLVMHEFQRRNHTRDDYRTFCATVKYQLNTAGERYRIGWKHVDLINAGGSPTVMATPL